jgi:hypothetical protein
LESLQKSLIASSCEKMSRSDDEDASPSHPFAASVPQSQNVASADTSRIDLQQHELESGELQTNVAAAER